MYLFPANFLLFFSPELVNHIIYDSENKDLQWIIKFYFSVLS